MGENLGAGQGVLKINKPFFDKNTDAVVAGSGSSKEKIFIHGNAQIGGITSEQSRQEASTKVILTEDEKAALLEEKKGFAGLGRDRLMSEETVKKAGTPVQDADSETERLAAARKALENRGR